MKKNNQNKNNLISISPPAPPASLVPSSPEPPVPTVPENPVPEKEYPNSDTCKSQILSDNKNKSGIYMWENKINGKRYIGSSENLKRRFTEYFNINYLLKNNSMYICNSLIKYDYSNFSLTILEYCEVSELLIREKYYWGVLKPEYNIAQDPTAPMSGRTHSEETKQIMSDTAKQIDNPGRFKTGHNHSEETKTKISDAHKKIDHSGRFKTGHIPSDETRTIMSDAKKGENNPNYGEPRPEGAGRPSQKIEVIDNKNNQTTTYDSIREAAKALNINQTVIVKYFSRNQKNPYKGQYTFKKIEG